MKATYLMIGDWVCIETLPMKVLRLCEHYIDVLTVKGNEIHTVYAEIKPIPLTEEILKMNGFVDGILPYTLCNTELQLSMQDNNGFWAFSIYAEHTEFCDLMMNYVHELQHALRLCGLNELADNFKIE